MKHYSKLMVASLLAASTIGCVWGVPAKPGIVNVTQTDGTILPVRIMGDERHHIYLSEDGFLLVNDHDTYYYADVDQEGNLLRSNIKAQPADMRSSEAVAYLQNIDMDRVYDRLNTRAEKAANHAKAPQRGPGLFPGTHFPSMGKQKAIVVLVEYTDVKMTLNDAYDYFNRMLNEPGFSDYGGTGSAYDYFMENSDGQFEPQFDVYGPITLAHNRSYYGGNDWWGNDQHPEEMVIEACQQLDETVDFSEYDRDGDGYIDNVFVFYAGRGEASGGSSDTVWPHSWDVSSATSTPYYFDGVRLDRYGCSNEYETGRPDGVGTFIHEFSHVMGIPDLYATSYTSSFTPGAWSAMDYGPYNNDGCTPPLYSAFERYSLNWLEPLPIDGPINATLYPIGTNQAGIIRTSKDNEFFLVENRQQTSWDTYIPGHGMLVWHVDYNESVWESNKVNNTPSHQYVDLEEADGTQNEYSRDGDAFPGTSHKTSFTDTTNPSMKTWGGQKLNLPITEIAESAAGVITFKVCGGRESFGSTSALEAEEISPESFVARWESAGEDARYVINVYTREGADGTITYVPGYENHLVSTGTSYEVTGLIPETQYYYTVSVGDGWEVSEPSNEIAVATPRLPINRRAVVADEAKNITHEGFTAVWLPLMDAENYTVSVVTKDWGTAEYDVCDFGNENTCTFPEGWVSNSGSSYANGSYSGESIPALRLSRSGDYLITPYYEDGLRYLSFWQRGNGTAETDYILVEYFDGNVWKEMTQIPVIAERGGEISEIVPEEMAYDAKQIRLTYKRTGTKGALAIDDVTIGYGMTHVDVPVAGYQDMAAGSGTEFTITGLEPTTTYYYRVRGIDADGNVSLPSQEIRVTTTNISTVVYSTGIAAPRIGVNGYKVTLYGASADSGLNIYDASGRKVATAKVSANGVAEVTLPSAGLYIAVLDSNNVRRKIIIR